MHDLSRLLSLRLTPFAPLSLSCPWSVYKSSFLLPCRPLSFYFIHISIPFFSFSSSKVIDFSFFFLKGRFTFLARPSPFFLFYSFLSLHYYPNSCQCTQNTIPSPRHQFIPLPVPPIPLCFSGNQKLESTPLNPLLLLNAPFYPLSFFPFPFHPFELLFTCG